MLFYSWYACQEFRLSKFIEKFVYVQEFVFVQVFNRKRDVSQLTYISIHKRDRR